jgi:exopolyphosphatase / guanosine-5'-triphosphate,3'-diphosphate pyrophosphatase
VPQAPKGGVDGGPSEPVTGSRSAAPSAPETKNSDNLESAKKPGDGRARRRRRGRRRQKSAGTGGQTVVNKEAIEPGAQHTSTKKKTSPQRASQKSQSKAGVKSRNKPQRGRFAHTYAALDLGTNNCRLLVARPQNEGFKIIDAFSRTVRLGQGLTSDDNGVGGLTDEAMDRAVDALKVCAEKIRRRGVTRARCIATEACRMASNGEAFIKRVQTETGLALEIITPQNEAILAVSGCAPLLDTTCDGAMVFDIGGGSTELVWLDLRPMRTGAEPKIIAWTSLPFGVVTLAETYLDRKPKTPEDERTLFNELVRRVRTEIDNFKGADDQRALYDTSSAHLIGNSGTVTTLAAVHLGLRAYDRRKVDGLWIDGQNLYDLVERLSVLGFEGRAEIPSVGADRADLLFPGCAILRAIQDTWPSSRVRVADRGLREGILVDLMEKAERQGRRKRRTRRGRRGGQRKKPQGNSPPATQASQDPSVKTQASKGE